MEKLRVLIVDDTVIYRKILSQAVESTGMAVVSHTASNGLIAVEWMEQQDVDVVLMDVFMPEMDGIEALKKIKALHPQVDVIMISSESTSSAKMTVEALELGAMDFILKPSGTSPDKNMEKIASQLKILFTQIKIKRFTLLTAKKEQETPLKKTAFAGAKRQAGIEDKVSKAGQLLRVDLVLIASSTGGPMALEKVCSDFKSGFRAPILVVQHMPPRFTKLLAESLDKKSKLSVAEGSEGTTVKNGYMIVAPGGMHMRVKKSEGSEVLIETVESPHVNGVRPAADVLFDSVAEVYEGKNILAVILTGMGSDGMKGVIKLKKKCNCYCITQSEDSCVVYGMPRSVFEAGFSDEVADIDDISKRIQEIAAGRS
ncbi:MAG: chemotaxis-specific protein-glutamate methyltransferase CheB [Bacillota bacterium]